MSLVLAVACAGRAVPAVPVATPPSAEVAKWASVFDPFTNGHEAMVFTGTLAVRDNGHALGDAPRHWPEAPAIACARAPAGAWDREATLTIWREDAATRQLQRLHFPRSGFPPLKPVEDTYVSFAPAWHSAACDDCEPRLSATMQTLIIDVTASSGRSGCTDCPEHGEYTLTATGTFARVSPEALTGEQVLACAGLTNSFTARGDVLVHGVEASGTELAPELRARAKPEHPYCTRHWRYRGEVWINRARPAEFGVTDLATSVELTCCDRPPAPQPCGPGPPPWVPDCETLVR